MQAKTSLPAFFALVFAFAIPFWILGAGTGAFLLPGLPIAALAFICPALAASVLVYRADGASGVRRLLARALDTDRPGSAAWYAIALLLQPVLSVLAFFILRASGTPVPAPAAGIGEALALGAIFFVSAVGEELGWSAYATEPLVRRWGVLPGAILLGAVWVVFHLVPLVEAHRALVWILWWSLGTVAARAIIVWLYLNAGRSVFVASLFHATANVTWQLFPVHGSFFDPRVAALLSLAAAVLLYALRPRAAAQ